MVKKQEGKRSICSAHPRAIKYPGRARVRWRLQEERANEANGTYIRNPWRRCINIVTLNVATSSGEAPVINRKPIITGSDDVKQINPDHSRRTRRWRRCVVDRRTPSIVFNSIALRLGNRCALITIKRVGPTTERRCAPRNRKRFTNGPRLSLPPRNDGKRRGWRKKKEVLGKGVAL